MTVLEKTATVASSLPYAYDMGSLVKTSTSKKEPSDRAIDTFGGITDGFNIINGAGLTFDPRIALSATHALGIVGAVLTLTYDGATLAKRVTTYAEIVKQKGLVPEEAVFKKLFIEAQQEYAKKLIASSLVGVTVDSLSLTASVVPVLSLPANLIAFIVSMGRIYAENKADKSLQGKLKEMTAKHREENPDILHAKDVFKEQHLLLKTRYEQAQAARRETAQALEEATHAMRQLPHKGSIRAQQKTTEEDREAEHILKALEAEFQASSIALTNLEAYEQAVQLIIELDPVLKRELHLTNLIEKHQTTYPEILEKDGVAQLTDKLKKELQILVKDLHRYRLRHHETPLLPHLHQSEYTVEQEKQINHIRAQLRDLSAYTKACKNLDKLKKQKQTKLAKKELSIEHFETSAPSSPRSTTPSDTTTIHTSRSLPSLHQRSTTIHISSTRSPSISYPSSPASAPSFRTPVPKSRRLSRRLSPLPEHTTTFPISSAHTPFAPDASFRITGSLSAESLFEEA